MQLGVVENIPFVTRCYIYLDKHHGERKDKKTKVTKTP
jgi:hypothetical protein